MTSSDAPPPADAPLPTDAHPLDAQTFVLSVRPTVGVFVRGLLALGASALGVFTLWGYAARDPTLGIASLIGAGMCGIAATILIAQTGRRVPGAFVVHEEGFTLTIGKRVRHIAKDDLLALRRLKDGLHFIGKPSSYHVRQHWLVEGSLLELGRAIVADVHSRGGDAAIAAMQAVDDDIVSFGKRPSRFVRGLMVVCAAVYIVEFFMRATLDRAVLLRMGANSPGLVDHQQWWRLMTSTFLHGSWFHLLFSLVALGTVGAQLERWLGWRAFAFLYLGSCFGGAYVSNLWAGGPLSVGSSTGLYGLLGVLAVSAWIFRDAPLAGPRVNAGQVVFLVITAALMNFMPNIDMAAHIGGFCTGAFLALFLVPRPVDGPLLRPQALFLASSLMVGAYALAIVDGVQHGLSKYTDFALEERVALSEKHHNRAALLQYTQRIYEMPDPTRADLARGLEVARRAVALNGQDVEARKIEAAFVARLRELPPGHK